MSSPSSEVSIGDPAYCLNRYLLLYGVMVQSNGFMDSMTREQLDKIDLTGFLVLSMTHGQSSYMFFGAGEPLYNSDKPFTVFNPMGMLRSYSFQLGKFVFELDPSGRLGIKLAIYFVDSREVCVQPVRIPQRCELRNLCTKNARLRTGDDDASITESRIVRAIARAGSVAALPRTPDGGAIEPPPEDRSDTEAMIQLYEHEEERLDEAREKREKNDRRSGQQPFFAKLNRTYKRLREQSQQKSQGPPLSFPPGRKCGLVPKAKLAQQLERQRSISQGSPTAVEESTNITRMLLKPMSATGMAAAERDIRRLQKTNKKKQPASAVAVQRHHRRSKQTDDSPVPPSPPPSGHSHPTQTIGTLSPDPKRRKRLCDAEGFHSIPRALVPNQAAFDKKQQKSPSADAEAKRDDEEPRDDDVEEDEEADDEEEEDEEGGGGPRDCEEPEDLFGDGDDETVACDDRLEDEEVLQSFEDDQKD